MIMIIKIYDKLTSWSSVNNILLILIIVCLDFSTVTIKANYLILEIFFLKSYLIISPTVYILCLLIYYEFTTEPFIYVIHQLFIDNFVWVKEHFNGRK